MLDAGVGYELLTDYADNHREAVAAFSNRRMPAFGGTS
jgi:enoyl-CoA hydratase